MMNKADLSGLVSNVSTQENLISALRIFLDREQALETARNINKMRFVGYVLELGYDTAKIITSDPYKLAVGGIPRGSFLIMSPNNKRNLPPHFTLLRVGGVAPTPLSSHVQQTYFELHKRSMPELDIWTQGELQWGALDCEVLGMFYADPENMNELLFSGDVNNVVSAHRYKIYAPDEALLELIVNGIVKKNDVCDIGVLRTMECKLCSNENNLNIPVKISLQDFKGCRTAMFGKTRLGKSNTVKLITQGMLEATKEDNSVGQIIFDINGEYANDNPQDGNASVRSAYESRCQVYALTERAGTPSKPLNINFYEEPSHGIAVLGSLLSQDGQTSHYIQEFFTVGLENIRDIQSLPFGNKDRAIRKIQMYWSVLHKAGFTADETRLKKTNLRSKNLQPFNPGFTNEVRQAVWGTEVPEEPTNLDALKNEFEQIAKYLNDKSNAPLKSSTGKDLFDPSDLSLLGFLVPKSSASTGPSLLRSYMIYHHTKAGDYVNEILDLVDNGKTVILDLGNATDKVRRYFSETVSTNVFRHQEVKFVSNKLENKFVQLYFEEAHNLFPPDSKDLTGVYARFAKEGAKFHIGMVYSTQSPSTINKDLLAQTENFFVGHLSSQDEASSLSRVQVAFAGCEGDILRSKTPGYVRMLTLSHRFVIPVQVNKFEASLNRNNA